MRPALVTLAVASSLLTAAPLMAQAAVALSTPSVFTLTPHIGVSTFSDIVKLPVHDDGSDPDFPFDGNFSAKLGTQLTLGVSAELQPLTTRWGAFADFSRSGGDARLAIRICDPEFGCDGNSLDAEGSQWRASAGVTRRFPVGMTSTATLSLGAVYGKTHFEVKGANAGVPDLDESSPGVVVGSSLDFPFTRRIAIRLQLRDAMMRVKGSTFARELNDSFEGSGLVVQSDDKFMNAFNFGGGVVLRW